MGQDLEGERKGAGKERSSTRDQWRGMEKSWKGAERKGSWIGAKGEVS